MQPVPGVFEWWKGAALAVVVALAGASAHAQTRNEFRVVVGSGVGGAYDVYARLVASHLGKYLPGNPTVIVQNMPGGGGLKAANYMAQIAPRDGSVIAIVNRNLIAGNLLDVSERANVQYDPAASTWIGNLTNDVSFAIVRADAGIKTIDDLRRRQVLVGSTTRADNNGLFPIIANNLIGSKFRVVSGYASSGELALALDRGEIEGIVAFSWMSLTVQRPHWLSEQKVRLVMSLGLAPIPQAADVPLMMDQASNPLDRQALELLATVSALSRPFHAPPDLSPDVTARLREAFAKAVADPQFQEMARRERLDVTFTDGAALQETVRRINSARPEVTEAARKAMEPRGDVESPRAR